MGIHLFDFLLRNVLIPMYKNICPRTRMGFAILAIFSIDFIATSGIRINPSAIKADPSNQ